jgi:antitoxin YefM
MAVETTYSNLRQNLAEYLDRVVDDREVIVVRRRGAEDVALIAASELSSILETAHLLSSPANANRLLRALANANKRKGKPTTAADLRHEFGL